MCNTMDSDRHVTSPYNFTYNLFHAKNKAICMSVHILEIRSAVELHPGIRIFKCI